MLTAKGISRNVSVKCRHWPFVNSTQKTTNFSTTQKAAVLHRRHSRLRTQRPPRRRDPRLNDVRLGQLLEKPADTVPVPPATTSSGEDFGPGVSRPVQRKHGHRPPPRQRTNSVNLSPVKFRQATSISPFTRPHCATERTGQKSRLRAAHGDSVHETRVRRTHS